VPTYDELIVVANKSRAGDPALRRFVDAVERGTTWMINHPQEGFQLFIKGRKDLDNELNRRAWAATLPRFAHSPAALDRARYTRFAEFLKTQGLIKQTPAVESYAVELR
jgi:putative hydroxymethylpyrimidine transport system substrate-binding protein